MSIEAMKQALEALDNLARYADTCELFLKETHPGKADALRERVTKSIEAITSLRQAIEQAEKSSEGGDCDSPSWCNQYGKCHRKVVGAPTLANCMEQAGKRGPEPIDHLLAENARLWGLIYDLHKKIAPDTTQAGDGDCTDGERLCAELKAKEQKEPVAWVTDLEFDGETELIPARRKGKLGTDGMDIPLYAQPQREWVDVECPLCGEMAVAHTHPNLNKREWVGLTDEEIDEQQWVNSGGTFSDFARAIEAKLKEKNT